MTAAVASPPDGRVRLALPGPPPDARPIDELARELVRSQRPILHGAATILNDEQSRRQLVAALADGLWDGEHVRVRARDRGLAGVTLRVGNDGGAPTLDASIGPGADLRALYHPLAAVLPVVGDDHCVVATRACADAAFDYLHPGLVGPRLDGVRGRRRQLLRYLGRLIDPCADGSGHRYVEPGVGRTYLVDFVRVGGQPELREFSVTGVGLTPFAADGFFFRDPHIDGHMPLIRARHRLRLAQVLREFGCRVPTVAAIITAPEIEHTMPDHSRLPGALMVRGFRTILRVKQLDPLANVLMTPVAWTHIQQLLQSRHWDADRRLRDTEGIADDPTSGDRTCTCLIPSFFLGVRAGRRCEESSGCRRQRVALMREHAPAVLKVAWMRLSEELGRDPETELVTATEYARWFAASLGAQLAAMRRARFLHDYRAAQSEWDDPYDLLNSLTDTNVTLLAELADLDTGVLVDRGEFAWVEALRISHDSWQMLRDDYDELHANEVRIARGIAETVAFAAGCPRARAAADFTASYEAGAR
jgi:hypothetical protein